MTEADKPRVYVSAIVCSDAIEEHGTHMLSALRISGGFLVGPILRPTADLTVSEWAYDTVHFILVITFNSEAPTSFRFGMKTATPDGRVLDLSDQPDFSEEFNIGAGAEGFTLKTRGAIPGALQGDYWVELLIDGQLVNKVPIRIVHPDLSIPRTLSLLEGDNTRSAGDNTRETD